MPLLWGGLVFAWILDALLRPELPMSIQHVSNFPVSGNSSAASDPSHATEENFAAPKKSVGVGPKRILDCAENQVFIPGGSFLMGASDGDEDEEPVRSVILSEYCLDKTEVTVAEYRTCVQAGACSQGHSTAQRTGHSAERIAHWSRFCLWGKVEVDNHPMNCVDWNQAKVYCAWKGGRLPSEAEWEFAARGDDGRRYPWGNQDPGPTRVNGCGGECVAMAKEVLEEVWSGLFSGDDGYPSTAPVGSFPLGASPFGILDMAGNVWEWTADGYQRYTQEAVSNPHNPASESAVRVSRGGGWSNFVPVQVRSTQRYVQLPGTRASDMGFRCAR